MAVALTAQSNAIAWGAVILGLIVALTGIAWVKIVTRNVGREARLTAEEEVSNWLQDEGLPLVFREVNQYLKTFPREQSTSEDEVAALVAAAGTEDDNGKE